MILGAGAAQAQDASSPATAGASYSADIPAEYQTHSYATEVVTGEAPIDGDVTVERTVDADGTIIETVTRTRRIERREGERVYDAYAHPTMHQGYYAQHAAYQPVVWDRETWLAECHARTKGTSGKKKGGIIGGLLGAITGGIIGNRAWDSERLLGTAIGAVGGGIIGGVIGSAIDSDGERHYYDCEEALDRYMSGAATTPRFASRAIPAHTYGYAPAYAYAPVYAQQYAYAEPMTYIETREEIPQRAVVREYVTEEWVEEAAPPRAPATRIIEETPPAPSKLQPIKRTPAKTVPIKGN